MKRFIAISAVLLLIVGSLIASAQMFGNSDKEDTDKRTVTVTGNYAHGTTPDRAQFTASVEVQKNTAKEAVDANRKAMNAIVSALKAAGVDSKDIQTENFYVYKKEEVVYPDKTSIINMPYKTQVVGWVATNSVRVTTSKLDLTGSLIDIASNAGATGFSGVSFTISPEKQSALESEMLAGAAKNAKTKADTLASALGAKVGNVLTISESSPIVYPIYSKNLMAGEAMDASTPIEPGQVQTSTSVYVSFELI